MIDFVEVQEKRALPMGEPGESFGRYFQRISFQEAVYLTVVAKNMGILPASFWQSYLRVP